MGRVSDETRERIRSEVDFADLLGRYTHTPQPGKNHAKWFCPFHEDGRTPAMDVTLDRQSWHCYACDIKGDIIDFVQRKEGLDYKGAVRFLCGQYGIEYTEDGPTASEESKSLSRLMMAAEEFYVQQLLGNPTALAYLREERGFTDETIADWRLGWAPGKGQLHRHLLERGYRVEDMLVAGVVRQQEGRDPWDFFYDRVLFPIHDAAGHPISFGGRLLAGNGPKYLNGPDSPLFRKGSTLYGLHHARKGISEQGSALVLEGYMDVVMSHQSGLDNALAVLGVAVTEKNLANISRLTRNLYLSLDNDAAGQRAALRAAELLTPELDLAVFATTIPAGIPQRNPSKGTVKDVDEFFRSGHTAADFRELMAASPGIYAFVVEMKVAAFDTEKSSERERAYNDAVAFLLKHRDSMTPFQGIDTCSRLSELLGMGMPGLELFRRIFGDMPGVSDAEE